MNHNSIIRIACLALAFTATGIFMFCLAKYIIPVLLETRSPALASIAIFSMICIAGFFISLFKPRSGSIMMFAGGLAMFAIFTILSQGRHLALGLMSGLPFMAAAGATYYRRVMPRDTKKRNRSEAG